VKSKTLARRQQSAADEGGKADCFGANPIASAWIFLWARPQGRIHRITKLDVGVLEAWAEDKKNS